jgi:hypothetical protein
MPLLGFHFGVRISHCALKYRVLYTSRLQTRSVNDLITPVILNVPFQAFGNCRPEFSSSPATFTLWYACRP